VWVLFGLCIGDKCCGRVGLGIVMGLYDVEACAFGPLDCDGGETDKLKAGMGEKFSPKHTS
jgi:hypothetical protein